MESPGAVGRRRGTSRSNVEDQALDQIAKEVSQSIFFSFFFHSTRIYRILHVEVKKKKKSTARKIYIFSMQTLKAIIFQREKMES